MVASMIVTAMVWQRNRGFSAQNDQCVAAASQSADDDQTRQLKWPEA